MSNAPQELSGMAFLSQRVLALAGVTAAIDCERVFFGVEALEFEFLALGGTFDKLTLDCNARAHVYLLNQFVVLDSVCHHDLCQNCYDKVESLPEDLFGGSRQPLQ